MKYTDVFERSKENGKIIIDIALDDYNDYYHEWDSARNIKRDIHPELYTFLEECSDQIPLKEKLEIRFIIENDVPDPDKEEEIRISFSTFFKASILAQSQKLNSSRFTVIRSIILGVVCLCASFIGRPFLPDNLLSEIILEGTLIGGWVFIWEAIHMSAFSLRQEKIRYRKYSRMKAADLLFTFRQP